MSHIPRTRAQVIQTELIDFDETLIRFIYPTLEDYTKYHTEIEAQTFKLKEKVNKIIHILDENRERSVIAFKEREQ